MKRIAAFVVAALFAAVATAQTLVPVIAASSDGPAFWPYVLVLAAVLVGGFWYLKRKDPAEAATLEAGVKAGVSDAVAAMHRLANAVEAHFSPAPVIVVADPGPPAPEGKVGVAGTITVTVGGNPAEDMAAFNAAYFRTTP